MNAISTSKLTKYYGKARGIEEVDLNVERGDFFGFIGPNGAGKSTTIRTLLGLISPTSGKASVLGFDIVTQKREILREVGYLPSEVNFYYRMRVGEILALSARLRGIDCTAESEELCRRLELDVTRRVDELSFGNKKKVGIVCALQHTPALCILDEPTSGLDPLMQREFYAILQEYNERGMTVFLSSHVLSEIERYCRHAAIIKEGRILVCDRTADLGYTGVKRVALRGVQELPASLGARDVKREGESLHFLFDGEISTLLGVLSALPVTDVNISDPEFDEVLMHYYAKEDAK